MSKRHLVPVALVLLLGSSSLPGTSRAEEAQGSDPDKVSMTLRDAPLGAVLKALASRRNLKLELPAELSDRTVSADLPEMTLDAVMDKLLAEQGYVKQISGESVLVKKAPPPEPTPPEKPKETPPELPATSRKLPETGYQGKLYVFDKAEAKEVLADLRGVVQRPGWIEPLPGDRSVLVVATGFVHEKVAELVRTAGQQRIQSRKFPLLVRKVDARAVGPKGDPRAPGADILREVKLLVSSPDTGASWEFDLRRQCFVVKDDPRVLVTIAERLALLDREPTRVVLEVALVQVPFGKGLHAAQDLMVPTNQLPGEFEGGFGPGLSCRQTSSSSLDRVLGAITGNQKDAKVLLRKTLELDEGSPATLDLRAALQGKRATLEATAEIQSGHVLLPLTLRGAGDLPDSQESVRVALRKGTVGVLRGLTKAERGTKPDDRRFFDVVMLLQAKQQGEGPDRESTVRVPGYDKVPELATPEDWKTGDTPK